SGAIGSCGFAASSAKNGLPPVRAENRAPRFYPVLRKMNTAIRHCAGVATEFPRSSAGLTDVQDLLHTLTLRRIVPSAPNPNEPATSIARALHRRLPERIQGAGTLYLWLRPGRTAARILRALGS